MSVSPNNNAEDTGRIPFNANTGFIRSDRGGYDYRLLSYAEQFAEPYEAEEASNQHSALKAADYGGTNYVPIDEVVDETTEDIEAQRIFELDQPDIHMLMESVDMALYKMREGTISSAELEDLLKDLKDAVYLTRETIGDNIDVEFDQMVAVAELRNAIKELMPEVKAKEEAAEIESRLKRAPERLAALFAELKFRMKQKKTARKQGDMEAMSYEDAHAVLIAEKIHEELNLIREHEPDRLPFMADELREEGNGHLAGAFKNVLLQFAKTHNSYHLSGNSLRRLESMTARSGYARAFLEAYQNRPEQNSQFGFIKGMFRGQIPPKFVKKAQNSIKKHVDPDYIEEISYM